MSIVIKIDGEYRMYERQSLPAMYLHLAEEIYTSTENGLFRVTKSRYGLVDKELTEQESIMLVLKSNISVITDPRRI